MKAAQGTLFEEKPLTYVVCCAECGPIAEIPVDASWHEAEQWAYLENVEHRRRFHR